PTRRSSDLALMPGGELPEHSPHAERDRVHADRGARDAADLFPHAQRVAGALGAELAPPGLVRHFAAVRLAVHEDVYVLETVRRIDRHEKGDRLVLTQHVAETGEAEQRVRARHAQHADRV